MRIGVLWWELPSYLSACLRVLAERHNVEILAVRRKVNSKHQWSDSLFSWMDRLETLPDDAVVKRWHYLKQVMLDFQPTVLLSSGWTIPEYWFAARWAKQRGITTICCLDTRWRGSVKQLLTIRLSRLLVRSFDYLWVPGPLQAAYGRRLGFDDSRILYNFYCADTITFGEAAERRVHILEQNPYPRRFLFVGMFAPWKGIQELMEGFRLYRQLASDPWELWCVGGGPEEALLKEQPGVLVYPFLQPKELAEIYAQAGIFVLPSLREPHGVVVHEAATVGLPILCSHRAGAALDFVRDGYNGFLFDPSDTRYLAHLMVYMSSGKVDLRLMGERSRLLAGQLICERWADYLIEMLSLKGNYLRQS